MIDNNTKAFLALIRAGLWEKDVRLLPFGQLDYSKVICLAEEQSLVGIVAAGLEHVIDIKLPKEFILQFVGQTLRLERRNTAMNSFIEEIVGKMRSADIYALLVKGQGVAQCYERPLWRACGDVDFLLSDENYERAKDILIPLASSVGVETIREKHLPLTINEWLVELHGTLYSDCLRKMDRVISQIQDDLFYGGNVRSWMNGHTHVFLPSVDNDILLVFSHILKHYFRNGIGLRQICDWSRLLWTYKDSLNNNLLESRIRAMGIMTEWKTFASLAVNTLGMPIEAMPFYDDKKKWHSKAERVLVHILKDGNFGHNRDSSYAKRHKPIVRKLISFWKHSCDSARSFIVFPLDSVRAWGSMVSNGVLDSGKE